MGLRVCSVHTKKYAGFRSWLLQKLFGVRNERSMWFLVDLTEMQLFLFLNFGLLRFRRKSFQIAFFAPNFVVLPRKW
jgi:hypothetical protein